MADKNDDLIANPSSRCACILVLDISGSMSGQPIHELNDGVSQFIDEVRNDEMAAVSVELGIVNAGGAAQEEMPLMTMLQVKAPPVFSAGGMTPLGEAVEIALNMLENRKQEYKNNGVPYYQPWLVIISDGAPTDAWQSAAARAQGLGSQKKLVVLPVGVQGADLSVLSQFSNKPAVPLAGLKFKEFFAWLSASMGRVSRSASTTSSVALPSTGDWSSI